MSESSLFWAKNLKNKKISKFSNFFQKNRSQAKNFAARHHHRRQERERDRRKESDLGPRDRIFFKKSGTSDFFGTRIRIFNVVLLQLFLKILEKMELLVKKNLLSFFFCPKIHFLFYKIANFRLNIFFFHDFFVQKIFFVVKNFFFIVKKLFFALILSKNIFFYR